MTRLFDRAGVSIVVAIFFALLFSASTADSTTLVPDATFGNGGSKSFNLQGLTPLWRFTRILPDGKILLAGKSCEYPSCTEFPFTLARLNPDGSLDRTFRPNDEMPGSLRSFGYEVGWTRFDIAGMDIDTQGRIVVAGRDAGTDSGGDLIVVRMLPNGDRDSSFSNGGGEPGVYRRSLSAQGSVQGMAIDAQDRIVVVGHVISSGKATPYATRVNANGTTDFNFNLGGPLAGAWTAPLTFDGGITTSVTHDSTGRVVLSGLAGAAPSTSTTQFKYLRFGGYQGYPFVVRLLGNGTQDASFDADGIATLPGFNSLTTRYILNRALLGIDSIGRIVVGGETQFAGSRGLAVFRLLSNGTEDATAWSYSPSWPRGGRSSPVTPMGPFSTFGTIVDIGAMKLDANGNTYITALVIPKEGQVTDTRPIVFRAGATTEPDALFAPSLGGTPPTVGVRGFDISVSALQSFSADGPDGISLAIDSAGNAVVAAPGQLPPADGPVLRVTPAGTLDPTFGSAGVAFTGATGNADYPYLGQHSAALLSDGRLTLVQTILRDQYSASFAMLGLVRLTQTGQVDETLNPAGRPPGLMTYWPEYDRVKFPHFSGGLTNGMLRDADDKLVVVSFGKSTGSFNAPMIVRFNGDGSIDPTFNAVGTYPGSILYPVGTSSSLGFQIVQDASKRYYIVGYAVVGGKTVAFVIRLRNDGTLDPTFSDGINPFVVVRFGTAVESSCSYGYALSLTASGKILVAGVACGIGSNLAGVGVARLNADGSADTSFNPTGLLPGALIVPSPPDVIDPISHATYQQVAGGTSDVVETAQGNVLVALVYGPPINGLQSLNGAGIARLTANGQLDLSYGTRGYFRCSACLENDRMAQLSRDASGGFFAATTGRMDRSENNPIDPESKFVLEVKSPVVLRLDAEGNIDATFGINGIYTIDPSGYHELHHLLIDPPGHLVVTGWRRATRVAPAETWVARYSVAASSLLVLQTVASRKMHGVAGTFDLGLGLVATNPTTEPRTGGVGGNHTIVFTFDQPLVSGTAAVFAGTAVVGVPTFSGNEMIVPLSGVTNQQYVTLSVSNVISSGGGTGSGAVRIGFLLGDVNQNRVVTLADLGLMNAQLAQPVTAANYLYDVNASGTLSLADKGITNANLTNALPAP